MKFKHLKDHQRNIRIKEREAVKLAKKQLRLSLDQPCKKENKDMPVSKYIREKVILILKDHNVSLESPSDGELIHLYETYVLDLFKDSLTEEEFEEMSDDVLYKALKRGLDE